MTTPWASSRTTCTRPTPGWRTHPNPNPNPNPNPKPNPNPNPSPSPNPRQAGGGAGAHLSRLYLPVSPCISPISLARLEEEQERAAGLEAEKGALAQQLHEARQEATHSRAALREVRSGEM